MKVTVAGIGPGGEHYLLPIVQQAIISANVIIGYSYYFQFIDNLIAKGSEKIAMALGQEEERAHLALRKASEGNVVLVIASGDAGIYSMASIVYELASQQALDAIELETLPGISAFLAVGSKLGAPLGHDFCCISLSDLITPWHVIEKRIYAAAHGDFVTCIYNPKSKKRYWQLELLKTIFLRERSADTPVAIAKQVTRKDECIQLTCLADFDTHEVDMFSLVMIGNSQTYQYNNHLITPRGYLDRKAKTGIEIQRESFRIVADHLAKVSMTPSDKWAVTRIIHTTGILDDHQYYRATARAIEQWEVFLKNGGDIVTDVTMVQAGITKKYSAKYGVGIHCFLNDEEAVANAVHEQITRTQAGIREGIKKFPNALFVIGNAPTALIHLTDELRKNNHFNPAGIIGVPVGFVNVIEAKAQLTLANVPHVTLEGSRGGSNVAAAIVNAVFTLEEARLYYEANPSQHP